MPRLTAAHRGRRELDEALANLRNANSILALTRSQRDKANEKLETVDHLVATAMAEAQIYRDRIEQLTNDIQALDRIVARQAGYIDRVREMDDACRKPASQPIPSFDRSSPHDPAHLLDG